MAGLLSDLSPSMSPGWQSVDLAVRALKVALRSVDFQRIPAVVAVVQSVSNTLAELISSYTTGSASGGGSEKPTPNTAEASQPSSDTAAAEADSQPSMAEGKEAAL